ncbi:hypothetical protein Tco_0888980 [Tanacetum coccineum]
MLERSTGIVGVTKATSGGKERQSPQEVRSSSLLRRKKEKLLDCNYSFLGEYECSSLALDREERIDEKKRLDHLKQDQTILMIKRFSERKKAGIPNGQMVAVPTVPDISGAA